MVPGASQSRKCSRHKHLVHNVKTQTGDLSPPCTRVLDQSHSTGEGALTGDSTVTILSGAWGDSAVTILTGAWPPSAAPVQGQPCSLCHVGEVAAAAVSGHGEPRHEHRVWPQGSKSYKLFPQVHRIPKDEICQDSHGWGPLTTTSSLSAHLSHHSHRVVVVLSKAEANVQSL